MDNKLSEQIIKAMVNWNGRHVQFDKKFLEYQDYTELHVDDDGQTITLTTTFKK